MSSATSSPYDLALSNNCLKSFAVTSCGWMALCPPSAKPIAHGLPGSSGPAVDELFFPFRSIIQMGWIGGRYRTSNPMDAIYGSRSSQSLNVPWPPLLEHDRGNISYQALNLAFSRS